jgi:opacity protein-like surface antigen
MRNLLVTLLAALMIPAAASAEAPKQLGTPATSGSSPYYAAVRAGMYMPQASDMKSFNSGIVTDLQFGHRLHENFAAEAGIGWFTSSTDEIGGAKATLSVVPLTATAKGILPFGKAELYGLGGLGVYFSKVELKSSVVNATDDDTSLGFHVGVGGQYAVTQSLSLGLEGRYVLAKVNSANIDGLMVNGGVAFHF